MGGVYANPYPSPDNPAPAYNRPYKTLELV